MSLAHVAQKAVILRADGKILALRRSATDPHRPLGWDMPGGEVEFGEDLRESIRREVREESGIEVSDLVLLTAIGYVSKKGEYRVSIGYRARVPQDTAVLLSSEHDRYEWLSREEFLTRDSTDRIKQFLMGTIVG